MKIFRIVVLGLTSLCILSSSCSLRYHNGYKKSEENRKLLGFLPLIQKVGEKRLFNTQIRAFGKEASGILLIKKTNNNDFRFIFLSHIGIKIFDAEKKDEDFKIHHLVSFIDKKSIRKIIKNDLLMLIKKPSSSRIKFYQDKNKHNTLIKNREKGRFYYWTVQSDKTIKQENNSILFKGTVLKYRYDTENNLQNISIKHTGLKLRWELQPIQK